MSFIQENIILNFAVEAEEFVENLELNLKNYINHTFSNIN